MRIIYALFLMISIDAMAFSFHHYRSYSSRRYRAPTQPVKEETRIELKSTRTDLIDYIIAVKRGREKGSFKKFERLWVEKMGQARSYRELREFMNLANKLGMKK